MIIGKQKTKFEIGDVVYHKLNGKRYMLSGILVRENSFFYYMKNESLTEESVYEHEIQEDKVISFDT